MDSKKNYSNKINTYENENKNQGKKIKDHLFVTKLWYSITKFEYYPEMAAHGVPRAFLYLTELIAIFSVLLTIILLIYVGNPIEGENQEDLNFVQRFEKTLGIQLNDEKVQELNETFNQYDDNTLETVFVIASVSSIFISYFIITLIDIITLSVFGMITCFLTKIKIKYRAVFNMSVYAMTISVILRLVYMGLLLLVNFKIKYFNIMYTAVSYICLAAAIFMIRADLIKQQIELMKIIEEKKQKSFEEEKKEEKEEKPKKKEDEEDKEIDKEPKEQEEVGRGEEQGSNA